MNEIINLGNGQFVKVTMLKGERGSNIATIAKTSTDGLVDTYTITLTDGHTTTFQVTNGANIGVENLGYVQTNNVAQKDFEVGEHLVLNDQYCVVTQAIAQGTTIAIGTNVEQETIGNEIDAIHDEFFIGKSNFDSQITHVERGTWDKLSGDDYKANYFSMQGGEYISYDDSFVLGIVDTSDSQAILVKIDDDFNVIERKAPQPLGHCNDMAYNPTLNKIFIATGSTGTNAYKIVVVDATTLEIENNKSSEVYGTNVPKWYISYDVLNDLYYIGDSTKIHVLKYEYSTNSWTQLKEFTYSINKINNDNFRITQQSSFCIDGKFVFMAFTENYNNPNTLFYNNFYLFTFDNEGSIDSIGRFNLLYPSEEPENICIKNGIGFVFSESNYFVVREIYFDRTKLTNARKISNYSALIPLKASSSNPLDLNDIMIPGVYSVANESYFPYISNMPVARMGNLYVEFALNSEIMQTYVRFYGGYVYRRFFRTSINGWSDWIQIAGDFQPVEEKVGRLGKTIISGKVEVGKEFSVDPNLYAAFFGFINNSYGQSCFFGIKSGDSIRCISIIPHSVTEDYPDGAAAAWFQINYGLKENSSTVYEVKSLVSNAPSNFTNVSYIIGIV